MIRITFITGAGKLGRQKYDENAAKVLTSTLRDLGYEDDRGASCINECAGLYKSQHDTGKNLKTIVVFPMIEAGVEQDQYSRSNNNNYNNNSQSSGQPLLQEGSPKEMIAMSSSMNTFERMIANKCPSWSQKKACLALITDLKAMVDTLDGKLLNGSLMSDVEQEFYDSISMDSLDDKAAFVKDAMKKHIDDGIITKLEKAKLVHQVKDKVETVTGEIEQCNKENKPKKAAKLSTQKDKLVERIETLDKITPKAPTPLKFQGDIQKLQKELQPLRKLERETKGRLLSIKETTLMGKKEEIEEDILILEERSRGWFEDDEDFQLRVDASRAKASTSAKNVVKKSASSGGCGRVGGVKKSITNWVVPGAGKKRPVKKATGKKSSATNAFAAMMMDSDSDSD